MGDGCWHVRRAGPALDLRQNSYQYSANGQLVSKTANTGTSRYTYDEIGNLLSVNLPDGTRVEYIVDGANRRMGKKVNGTLVQGARGCMSPTT